MSSRTATSFCPRCGSLVGTWHTRPECDAAYDKAYRAASVESPEYDRGYRAGLAARKDDAYMAGVSYGREDAATELFKAAANLMEIRGPHDPRGAAIWDAAALIAGTEARPEGEGSLQTGSPAPRKADQRW